MTTVRRPPPRPAPRPQPRPAPRPQAPEPAPQRSSAPERPRTPPTRVPGRAKPQNGAQRPDVSAHKQGVRRPVPQRKGVPRPQVAHGARKPVVRPTARAAAALGTFLATAYGPPWDAMQGSGVTATGIDLRPAKHEYIIAVDPTIIPLHTRVHVVPNPFGDNSIVFRAEDTGGAIKGHHIDIYDWRGRRSQLAWGARNVTVTPTTAKSTAPTPTRRTVAYVNPLKEANVTPERIDQGVDYAGTGYYVALADCRITAVAHNGWGRFGNYVEYIITTEGELHDVYVYYAEGVNPLVKVGDVLKAGDRIVSLAPGWPSGTEIGFAAGDGTYHTWSYVHDGPYVEGTATRAGIAFSNLVKRLGGPGGRIEGVEVGRWPDFAQNGQYGTAISPQASEPTTPLQDFVPLPPTGTWGELQWGGLVETNWHRLAQWCDEGSHHTSAARAFAEGKTYVEKAK